MIAVFLIENPLLVPVLVLLIVIVCTGIGYLLLGTSGAVLQEIRKAVSDRGSGVRSRGEGPPTRGARQHRR